MQLTSRQFRSLAADVDDLHNENMKTFAEETADLHLDLSRLGSGQASRRTFIAGSAGLVGAVAIGSTMLLPRGLTLGAAAAGLDDATIAGYAQSVELAAVAAYTAAAAVLSKDTLPVGELFMSHHQQHADAFGAVAGTHATTEANPKLLAAVGPALAAIKDEMGALEFAFVLEGQAAYTYAAALTLLTDPAYAAATATILPIEAQHQTVLGLALGKSVEDCFPTGAFESTKLGDGTDPLAGLDPAVFG